MLLINVPRWDLSIKPEKSSLHCCHKWFVNIPTLFTRSVHRFLEIHRRQPSWIFRDRPIYSRWIIVRRSFLVLRGCPSRWYDLGTCHSRRLGAATCQREGLRLACLIVQELSQRHVAFAWHTRGRNVCATFCCRDVSHELKLIWIHATSRGVELHKGPFTLTIFAAILAAILAAISSAISRRVNYWRFKSPRHRQ